ncbi:MAG TPA: CGNR zinc finger domain-containing protein [Streptosporangiaceae bacterium]
MNLASFAELAVRLVNSGVCAADTDPLRSCEAFREFVAGRPFLAAPVTPHDLGRLRLLRTELGAVFAEAAAGHGTSAVARLNALLAVHPVHPEIVSHDGEPYHVHLSDAGSMTDRYTAASVISLALLLSQLGLERFGICTIASCDRVFIDGSSNKSRRYCSEHAAGRGNVTALLLERQAAAAGRDRSITSAAS